MHSSASFLFLGSALLLGNVSRVAAQPTIRSDKAYEDTVRILIISNNTAQGNCGPPTDSVGIRTRDFVRKSLEGVPNVVMLESKTTRWEDVLAVWPGKLPHVIVHVNAGWSTESGDFVPQILNTAADSAIGVVSIGDDAASFAQHTFGFKNVNNQPEPMGDAMRFNTPQSRLWLDLDGSADTVGGGGIIRNTTQALNTTRLFFNPVQPYSNIDPAGRYRCQADADKYEVDAAFADKVTFMGYQRAFDGTDTVAGPRELQAIVSFQDNVRRGVALSYQPQFLADEKAAHQIDYDAIMYASFAHFFRDPSLVFTDETGKALAPGADWSAAKGKLYLNYTDDYVRADLGKTVILRISNGAGAPADSETIVIAAPVKTAGGKGLWRGEIPLAARGAPTRNNGTAEVTLPAVIDASVSAHDENGLPDGRTATARLVLNAVPVPPVPPVPPVVIPPVVVDTILSAYMRDVDGNGAGDQACFIFSRPLDALPASIGPVYWNAVSPAFANKRPPRLSFLPGTGQRGVAADFSGAEFPVGLTSVPPGATPYAVFPSEGVFGGQKPALADSMGPVLIDATIALGSEASAERIPDTLTVTLSEPLRAGFPSLIRFGRFNSIGPEGCRDRGTSVPATVRSTAAFLDGLRYVLILDPAAPNPISGDCAYLEGNGSVLDLPGNAPSALGIRIKGPKAPLGIRAVSGFPAVSGTAGVDPLGGHGLQWIPPVGYRPDIPFAETDLPASGQPSAGTDASTPQNLPPDAALVRVASTGRYIAHVFIFDNLGVFVRTFSQSFGYKGELANPARREIQGYRSFLVWDRRDAKGRRAGQGVYLWRVEFLQDDRTTFTRILRTGLLR